MKCKTSTISIISKDASEDDLSAFIDRADIYLPDTDTVELELKVGETILVACGAVERFPKHVFLNFYQRTE